MNHEEFYKLRHPEHKSASERLREEHLNESGYRKIWSEEWDLIGKDQEENPEIWNKFELLQEVTDWDESGHEAVWQLKRRLIAKYVPKEVLDKYYPLFDSITKSNNFDVFSDDELFHYSKMDHDEALAEAGLIPAKS